jgi:hypothetical protein
VSLVVQPIARKEVNLHIVELPSRVLLERPFLVRLSVSNQTDRHIGPLQISMSQDDAQGVSRAIVVNGLWTMVSSISFSVDGISVVWNGGIQGLK